VTKTKAEFRPEYGLMPYLDLEASLYLTGTQITLATQGWAGNELFFTLSSNPAKSREEIFAMLNWSEQLQDPESLSLLKLIRGNIAAVTDGILGPFFDEFRQLIQVDLFNLEQDRAFGGLRMSIGKALGRDVFLSYRRNLSTLSEEVWTLEGRLTLNLSLLGEYSTNQGWQWRIFYNIWL
jgi:autotransporter translocation and assembly factor TamB